MDQKKQTVDDISLIAVKDSVLYFLLILQSLLKAFFDFLKRNAKKIVIPTLIATAGGVLFSFLNEKTYTLKMTVEPSEFSRRIYADQYMQLDKLIKTKSYSELTKQLSAKENVVQKLRGIQCVDIYGLSLQNDTSTVQGDPFVIAVTVSDISVAPELQNALLKFINSNPYFINRKKVQTEIFTNKLVFIENELKRLDSLKISYNSFMNSSNNKAVFYNNAFNPADLYQRSGEYQNQKDMLLSWLGLEKNSLRLMDGFKPAIKADSLSRTGIIFLALGIGLLAGILIAGYSELERFNKQAA